ncbi:iron(III) transport system permease protein [Paracoccus versutus]|uniref:Iron(III) transport system permease protein n=2 Tax=Paracoccus versutus TaxID=34007 RepID=A0AAQ0HEM5_PARVE|nr:iron ABC transporter permease [Paracoccus versutus]REG35283.1 iron(III) transport system permease protein [Paracoccus versutus]SFY30994.1 iron(III) transport system permease protein [Paracoccus pantotrophus]
MSISRTSSATTEAVWEPDTSSTARLVVRNGLLILLVVLIALPLLVLIYTSFLPPGAVPLSGSELTLDNYRSILTGSGTVALFVRTIIFAVGSSAIGIVLGISFAYLTERTDLPGRTAVRILMFSWMAVPALVFGYGWILLLNPGNGIINVMVKAIFNLEQAPFTPYSMQALTVIAGLGAVPTAYIMVSGLLRNMDPSLEDAAFVSGASRFVILRKITAPLLTPGTLSISIYLIMTMVQHFDLPMIIGLTAQTPVLSTSIYMAAAPDFGLPNYGLAAAFGVFLAILAGALMFMYFRVVHASERYRTVTGKSFRPKLLHLRGLQKVFAILLVGGYFALMLMPLLTLAWASLFPYYRLPSFAALADASFAAYFRVFSEPQTFRVIVNTVLLFLTSSTLAVVLSCLVSWFAVRLGGKSGRAMDLLSFAPTAIPPIVMAIALLMMFLRTPLNGTIWVIVIGHIAMYLSFGTRAMNGALIQIHRELEDAATVSGASWGTSLRKVLFPIIWPHILNTWLWIVAHSARDLTFPLFLLTSSNVVVATAIYQRWNYPDLPGTAALCMMLVLALSALVIPIQIYLEHKNLNKA